MARVAINIGHPLKTRVYAFNGTFDTATVRVTRLSRYKHKHPNSKYRQEVDKQIRSFTGIESVHLCMRSVLVTYDERKIPKLLVHRLDEYVYDVMFKIFDKPGLFLDTKRRKQKLKITVSEAVPNKKEG